MEPLFQAITHGCQASKHQEVMDKIFYERIQRKDEAYLIHKLGAFGSFLSALSNFFETPWSHPSPNLTEHDQASALNWAGFSLRALGRLEEAKQPLDASLKARVKQKDWKNAARGASNLSELTLTQGSLLESIFYGEKSVSYADQSKDEFMQESRRTVLADALHQSGQIQEAETLFQEAETLQKKRQPEYPYLFSLPGFRYCDLLLSQDKSEEVLQRATQTIEVAKQNHHLISITLDNLTLARAHFQLSHPQESQIHFEKAITGLREAGAQEFLILGLIHRSHFLTKQSLFSQSQENLDEAIETAQLGGMNLYLADAYLASCRLHLAQNQQEQAKSFLTQAKTLIEEMGYHRRDKEVKELEKNLNPKNSF